MRIGTFVKRTGLSRDTIRFYERRGLLRPAVLPNGYRDFPEPLVERARQIRLGQSLGFTLAVIATLLKEWEVQGMSVSRQLEVLAMQETRVNAQLKRLLALHSYLQAKRHWLESGALGEPPALEATDRGDVPTLEAAVIPVQCASGRRGRIRQEPTNPGRPPLALASAHVEALLHLEPDARCNTPKQT